MVGENQIKNQLEKQDEKGGILIVLDLDDMKGINDSLGHREGDVAIMRLSGTIRTHFRKNDILVRAGGDEFVIFLPGAGRSVNAVKLSIQNLLQKISGISVGDKDNKRYLSCSVGCAVEQIGIDTYDTLFKRADIALYHVKRGGKNNFAFYEPEMSLANYKFKDMGVIEVSQEIIREDDMRRLLNYTASSNFSVVLFNLTKDYSRVLSVGENVGTIQKSCSIREFFLNEWIKNVHPGDQDQVLQALSRNALLLQYTYGKRQLECYYRSTQSNTIRKVEAKVHFM